MNEIAWADPAVQAAAIEALGTFVATLIATLCAALVGQQINGRKRLIEKLEQAHQDIDFLLSVETEHCFLHAQNGRESNKIRIRNVVRDKGLSWSGKCTPGRR